MQNQILNVLLQNRVNFTLELLLEFERHWVLRWCYPNMHYLTLMNQAVVEKSFSLMNRIYTPLRKSLNQVSLESLMRICWEGEESYSPKDLESLVVMFRDRVLILLACSQQCYIQDTDLLIFCTYLWWHLWCLI